MQSTTTNALIAILLFALAGCSSAPLINPPPLSANTDLEATRDAIVSGMAVREWKIVDESPNEILATVIVRGKHEATVRIQYDQDRISFEYVDSVNLEYEERNGDPYIHKNYNSWVANLRSDVAKQLELQEPDEEE